ncbi:MAG TPA: hypothetical protein EYG11_11965, partial [Candidatus Latescibacteria bacterium]|nr:hypothetical protein [Candidatus Latescibacterota bacterium]
MESVDPAEVGKKKNFATLKAEIIDTGLCSRCGGCVGVCPDDALEIGDVL